VCKGTRPGKQCFSHVGKKSEVHQVYAYQDFSKSHGSWGGRWVSRLNCIHLDSIGFAWTYLGSLRLIWITPFESLGLNWTQWVSLGITWIHLDSFGFTWIEFHSLGPTWIHLVSLGLSWTRLDARALTWIHMDPLGFTQFSNPSSFSFSEQTGWLDGLMNHLPGAGGILRSSNQQHSIKILSENPLCQPS
jgi:hypothetical protein